jgi:hypothetical protein
MTSIGAFFFFVLSDQIDNVIQWDAETERSYIAFTEVLSYVKINFD